MSSRNKAARQHATSTAPTRQGYRRHAEHGKVARVQGSRRSEGLPSLRFEDATAHLDRSGETTHYCALLCSAMRSPFVAGHLWADFLAQSSCAGGWQVGLQQPFARSRSCRNQPVHLRTIGVKMNASKLRLRLEFALKLILEGRCRLTDSTPQTQSI